jgi:hypothetical protein
VIGARCSVGNCNDDYARHEANDSNMRVLLVIAALIIAAGCEAPRTKNDPRLVSDWSFQPPHGWTEVGNQSWRSSSPPQLIALHIMPAAARHPIDLRWVLEPYSMKTTRITLCHGLPALFGERHFWFGSNVDEIATQKSGSIAIASYYYPRFYDSDASAESSIRSICPRTR